MSDPAIRTGNLLQLSMVSDRWLWVNGERKMLDDDRSDHENAAEELLRRALIDDSAAVAVSLRVGGLPVSDAVTVIFHGRRDLGTLQTYVTRGSRTAGTTVAANELLRVPCDLDLADAIDREEAERLYIEQATAMRDALLSADTVLEVWREPLCELLHGELTVDHSVELSMRLPAPRLLPTALVAPDRQLVVTPVCGARTLAEGKPPLGIACAQQDLTRVYPLADDPAAMRRGLPPAGGRARALAGRATGPPGSLGRALHGTDRSVKAPPGAYAAAVRRSRLILLIVVGVAAFLVVSGLLARIWTGDSAEQSAVTALIRDEASGDAAAMITTIRGCSASAACRQRAQYDAATLKHPGNISVIDYGASTGFSLGSTLGTARVAWEIVGQTKPVVQCVRVRRAGNVISGITIQLLKISQRINSGSDCPARY